MEAQSPDKNNKRPKPKHDVIILRSNDTLLMSTPRIKVMQITTRRALAKNALAKGGF